MPADLFVTAWIDGKAAYSFEAEFHRDFPASPHKEDSERFEAATRCLGLRGELGEAATSGFVAGLVARLEEPGTDADTAQRIIEAIGWIGDLDAVEPLCAILARRGSARVDNVMAAAAAKALACFGARNARFDFSTFGGRFMCVVFPARPDPRATAALVEALCGYVEGESVSLNIRRESMRALEYHCGDAVEAAALAVERHDPSNWANASLLSALSTDATRERLCTLAPSVEDRFQRENVAFTLGWLVDARAIEPLYGLLADPEERVRTAATLSLYRLAGITCGVRRFLALPEGVEKTREEWEAIFGSAREKFDPDKAERQEALAPGIYRMGP